MAAGWAKPVAAAAAVATAGAVVAAVPPHGQALYPPCLFHRITGMWCPACGSTRAVHALLTGDITGAVHDNLVLLVILPVVIYAWLAWLFRATGKPLPWPAWLRATPVTTAVAAVVLVAFGVLRNLPGAPFTGLAPLGLVH